MLNSLDTAENKIKGIIVLLVTFFISFVITTWIQIAFAKEQITIPGEAEETEELKLEGGFEVGEEELPAICFEVSREYFCYREG